MMEKSLIPLRRLALFLLVSLFVCSCTSEAERDPSAPSGNAAGKIQTLIRQRPQGGGWVNVYRRQFTYDAAGRQKSMQHADWIGGRWKSSYKHVYARNRQGQEKKIVSLRWKKTGWDTTQMTSFKYDSLGRKSSVFSRPLEDGPYANMERAEYRYLDSGRVVTAVTLRPLYDDTTGKNVELADKEVAWTTMRIVTKRFNEDSLLTRQTTEQPERALTKTTYHYDEGHKLARQVEQKQSKDGWRNSRRVFFTYNDDGKVEEKRVQSWNGSEWASERRSETTFERGWPQQIITWQRQNGTWQKTSRLLYKYR